MTRTLIRTGRCTGTPSYAGRQRSQLTDTDISLATIWLADHGLITPAVTDARTTTTAQSTYVLTGLLTTGLRILDSTTVPHRA